MPGKPWTEEETEYIKENWPKEDSSGHYFLNQAQSPHDRECPDEVWNYVDSYISKENEDFDKISAS